MNYVVPGVASCGLPASSDTLNFPLSVLPACEWVVNLRARGCALAPGSRFKTFPFFKFPITPSLSSMSHETIESHLVENRVFAPPEAFARGARVTSMEDYQERYAASIKDPSAFWVAMITVDNVLDETELLLKM